MLITSDKAYDESGIAIIKAIISGVFVSDKKTSGSQVTKSSSNVIGKKYFDDIVLVFYCEVILDGITRGIKQPTPRPI